MVNVELHLSKLQTLELIEKYADDHLEGLIIEDDNHSFYYNEWFEAEMFQLMSAVIKSTRLSFTRDEIKWHLVKCAVQSGTYRQNEGATEEQKKRFIKYKEGD